MATIDLTLNSFLIPNFSAYTPSFGTKKTGEKEGLTSMETHLNIAMGFQRQRPSVVSENSETTIIEADSMIILDGVVLELRLGNGSFVGCKITLINNSGHKVTLLDGTLTKYIYASKSLELHWLGQSWQRLAPNVVGRVVYTMISDDTELAKDRLLLQKGQIISILPDYEELVDRIWRGSSSNNTVQTYYKCNDDGTRNSSGNYFKLPDGRGRVIRGTGQGDEILDKDGFPITGTYYQGGNVGDSIGDAIRNISGDFRSLGYNLLFNGPFFDNGGAIGMGPIGGSGSYSYEQYGFDASRIVPTAKWNRDASISANMCLVY